MAEESGVTLYSPAEPTGAHKSVFGLGGRPALDALI